MLVYTITALLLAALLLGVALATRPAVARCRCGRPAVRVWSNGEYVCERCMELRINC